jgi:hypothetical protein
MKGFSTTKQQQRSASYWVAAYAKDNDDEPIAIEKKILIYKTGQDKEAMMMRYCNSIMKINHSIWEILVHQGPSEVPDTGDQIVIRVSREPFKGCVRVDNK